MSRIDIHESDGFSVHGNGKFERKVAFLSAHGPVARIMQKI